MAFKLKSPTLQQIVLSQFAISMWKSNFPFYISWDIWPNSPNNCAEFEDIHIYDDPQSEMQKLWRDIYDTISGKVSVLDYPEILKQNLLNESMRYVGLELYTWLRFLNLQVTHLDRTKLEICAKLTKWTLHGKIDETASATELIQCDELPLNTRYEIACIFCIADKVSEIWQQNPLHFNDFEDDFENCSWKNTAVKFWFDIMTGSDVNQIPFVVKANRFTKAVHSRILSAVEFFFNLFTPEEKTEILTDCLASLQLSLNFCNHTRNVSVVHFLLSQMSEECLQDVFNSKLILPVMSCLLGDVVYSELVEPVVNRAKRWFGFAEFCTLLCIVIRNAWSLRSRRLSECFTCLWRNAESEWKKYVLSVPLGALECVYYLFKLRDEWNMSLLLSEMNLVERRFLFQCFCDACHWATRSGVKRVYESWLEMTESLPKVRKGMRIKSIRTKICRKRLKSGRKCQNGVV